MASYDGPSRHVSGRARTGARPSTRRCGAPVVAREAPERLAFVRGRDHYRLRVASRLPGARELRAQPRAHFPRGARGICPVLRRRADSRGLSSRGRRLAGSSVVIAAPPQGSCVLVRGVIDESARCVYSRSLSQRPTFLECARLLQSSVSQGTTRTSCDLKKDAQGGVDLAKLQRRVSEELDPRAHGCRASHCGRRRDALRWQACEATLDTSELPVAREFWINPKNHG
jgi:hypothetical protein